MTNYDALVTQLFDNGKNYGLHIETLVPMGLKISPDADEVILRDHLKACDWVIGGRDE
jgi:hypothetical protein